MILIRFPNEEAKDRASANEVRAAELEKETTELRKQIVELGPRYPLLAAGQKRLISKLLHSA